MDLDNIQEANWVFFSSKHGYKALKSWLKLNSHSVKIGAIGPGTTQLIKKDFLVNFEGNGNPESCAVEFAKQVGNEKVFFPCGDISLRSVQHAFPQSQCIEKLVYRTIKKKISLPAFEIYVFTSPSNVDAFFESNNPIEGLVIAIGSSTALRLKNHGVSNVKIAWTTSELALADLVGGLY